MGKRIKALSFVLSLLMAAQIPVMASGPVDGDEALFINDEALFINDDTLSVEDDTAFVDDEVLIIDEAAPEELDADEVIMEEDTSEELIVEEQEEDNYIYEDLIEEVIEDEIFEDSTDNDDALQEETDPVNEESLPEEDEADLAGTSLGETGERTTQFIDVTDPSQFYYDPIYWAVDRGIVSGYDDNTFRPMNYCNRAAAVTFLWRLAGKPDAGITNAFSDMTGNSEFDHAIIFKVALMVKKYLNSRGIYDIYDKK